MPIQSGNHISGSQDAPGPQDKYPYGDPVVISTGRKSPFPLQVSEGGGTAKMFLENNVAVLAVGMNRPSATEVDMLGKGEIDVALDHERGVAFIILVFGWNGFSFAVDAPLHLGLENATVFPNLALEELPLTETKPLVIVLQDETGIVQRIRSISMPRIILERLAPMIKRQIAERDRHNLQQDYDKAIRHFNRRTKSPSRAFAAAMIKASVA